MKRKNKIVLVSALAVTITASVFSISSIPAKDISVTLDGNVLEFDVAPEVIDGRTMVPMRKIFEELGALVKWDADTQTVQARKSAKTVTLTVNSDQMILEKNETDEQGNPISDTVTLDVSPIILNDRTMVPMRAVSEAFGADVDWNSDTKTVSITSKSDDDETWKENKATINLSDLTYSGNGISVSESGILITEGGDYTLTGTLTNGNVTVDSSEKVKIRLSEASISSNGVPCIYFENASKAYITVSKDTKNYLTCVGGEKGAIYSKDNLEIKGNGYLLINSDACHGIKASDNLTIESGEIEIDAKKDAVNVNDTFKMTGGTLKTVSEGDGIDCESIVIIEDGTIDITTTAEPVQSTDTAESNSFKGPGNENIDVDFESSSKGIKADWMMCISGGTINVNSADHAIHCADEIEITGANITLSSQYGKGISAHGNFVIDGEDTFIDVQKSTEGLESKNILTINNGTIKIVASDDAINATGGNSGNLEGFGGNLGGFGGFGGNFEKNDAGKPGKRPDSEDMTPHDGEGMTPPDGMGMNQRPNTDGRRPNRGENGGNTFTKPDGEQNEAGAPNRREMKDCLVINGGNFEIYGGDDCFDSNGNLTINGGVIKASLKDGSFAGNFAIFDADGQISINEGAEIIAVCSNGEEKSLSIPQNAVYVYCNKNHTAGEKVTVTDDSGNVICEYEPACEFKTVLVTSPQIEIGKTYNVSAGDESFEVNVLNQTTTVGTKSSAGGFGHGNFRDNKRN